MKVPFVDLARIHEPLLDQFRDCLVDAVADSAFVGGHAVEAFEEAWAEYCGAPHCVAVSSGTDALALALRASGVAAGSEVILPANTFVATAEAVVMAGCRPVLVDVDLASGLMVPAAIGRALTPKTAAVIPVHLYGRAVELSDLNAPLAKRPDVLIIEDACQAHGLTPSPCSVAACWSFYPGKNLGALGDAGAITTHDGGLAETARCLRDHGAPRKAYHAGVGGTFRMDALQAAFLSVKLPHLDEWNRMREYQAAHYHAQLDRSDISTGQYTIGTFNAWHLYVVRTTRRARLARHLAARGIETGIHYPVPIHLQPGWSGLGYRWGAFPAAEARAGQILSLPMFAGITDEEVNAVCEAVEEFFSAPERANPEGVPTCSSAVN